MKTGWAGYEWGGEQNKDNNENLDMAIHIGHNPPMSTFGRSLKNNILRFRLMDG